MFPCSRLYIEDLIQESTEYSTIFAFIIAIQIFKTWKDLDQQ